jgi:hypothetical protein
MLLMRVCPRMHKCACAWRIATRHTVLMRVCGAGEITSFKRIWRNSAGKVVVEGTDWAAGGVFARLLYATYSEEYFSEWGAGYNPGGAGAFNGWALYDFGKPGCKSFARSRGAPPRLVNAWNYNSDYQNGTVRMHATTSRAHHARRGGASTPRAEILPQLCAEAACVHASGGMHAGHRAAV